MEAPASDMATDAWVNALTRACRTEGVSVCDAERWCEATRRIMHAAPWQPNADRAGGETDRTAFLTAPICDGTRSMPQWNPVGANADAEDDGNSGRGGGRGRGQGDRQRGRTLDTTEDCATAESGCGPSGAKGPGSENGMESWTSRYLSTSTIA